MQLQLHLTNHLIRAVAGITAEDAFGVYAHPARQQIRREPAGTCGLGRCASHWHRRKEPLGECGLCR